MAYDPEARANSNVSMVIGIIVLILIVGGAIVYMTSRPSSVATTPSTIIHDQAPAPAPQAVPVPVPSSPAPNVTINPPAPSSSSSTTTTTTDKGTSSDTSTSSGSD